MFEDIVLVLVVFKLIKLKIYKFIYFLCCSEITQQQLIYSTTTTTTTTLLHYKEYLWNTFFGLKHFQHVFLFTYYHNFSYRKKGYLLYWIILYT